MRPETRQHLVLTLHVVSAGGERPEGRPAEDQLELTKADPIREVGGAVGELKNLEVTTDPELARQLQQAYAVDHDNQVWSFGQIPQTRQSFLQSAIAPDFTLADRQGNPVSLSDFRGQTVLIGTWASW